MRGVLEEAPGGEMHLFGEVVDTANEPEKEIYKLCNEMPDGGRMGRC